MNTIKTKDKIEIKPGYKKTKVGLIPEDWEVKRLGEIGLPKMCKRIFKEQTNTNEGIPFYKIGTFGGVPDAFITKELFDEYKERYSFPKKGDILISAAGTIGRLVVYDGEPAYFQDSNIVWIDNNEELISNKLLYYIYSIVRWQKTEGGIVSRLYNSDLKKVKLPIPPLAEQKAIADCLSTWDKGIEKLSALIASKKEQKKGLMQGLFSGELKVENGELVKVEDEKLWLKGWKEVKLGDISIKKTSNIQSGLLIENSGKYNVYGASGFITKIDTYDEEKPYIGIVKDGSGVGNTFLLEGKSSVLSTLDKILPKKNSNLVFLYSLIKKLNFEKYKVGGAIPHIYYKDYSKEKVLIPSIQEQTAIAEILQTADKEIELLEQKLESYKIQKKGLMQVLLTGTKRLVESGIVDSGIVDS